MNPIIQTAQVAAELHAGQLRKWTGRPYIEHPARVAGRACLIPDVPEHVVAAAWLHDVLEDCNVNADELRSKTNNSWIWASGEAVKLVVELTNPSKGSKALRAERKAQDREHIKNASHWAKCLKAIDRTDNLREMGQTPEWNFISLYLEESKLLTDALAGCDAALLLELNHEISRTERAVQEHLRTNVAATR